MQVDVDTDDQTLRAERPVRKSGNSKVISLPSRILQEAGLDEGDNVDVSIDFQGDEITLRPTRESTEASA